MIKHATPHFSTENGIDSLKGGTRIRGLLRIENRVRPRMFDVNYFFSLATIKIPRLHCCRWLGKASREPLTGLARTLQHTPTLGSV